MADWHKQILQETKPTILDCLSDENIIDVEITENGLEINEACDRYYGRTLSPNQLDRLIEELKEIRAKL